MQRTLGAPAGIKSYSEGPVRFFSEVKLSCHPHLATSCICRHGQLAVRCLLFRSDYRPAQRSTLEYPSVRTLPIAPRAPKPTVVPRRIQQPIKLPDVGRPEAVIVVHEDVEGIGRKREKAESCLNSSGSPRAHRPSKKSTPR